MNDIEKIWEILHSYEADVFGYIKHAVDSADIARDLYQDVYLSALQNIHQLDPERSLKNWLMTVARNRIINYYRERNRREFVTFTEETGQTENRIADDAKEHIRLALNKLNDRQKDIIIARDLDGLTYKELADKMNLSESAVTSLIDRARKNFTKAILLQQMPEEVKKNAGQLTLEDLARFVDSFDSLDRLISNIELKSQKYFAEIHKNWDDIRKSFINTERLNMIISRLGKQQDKVTLDLGSGTGFIALHCALNGNHVISVDLNKSMLQKQLEFKKRLNLENMHLFQADINRLSFSDQSFDQIFLTLVLHHISDPPGVLKQTAAKLKKDGTFVVIDFVRHKNRKFADQMHDLWLGFDPDKIKSWLKNTGLKLISSDHWQSEQDIKVFFQIYSY